MKTLTQWEFVNWLELVLFTSKNYDNIEIINIQKIYQSTHFILYFWGKGNVIYPQ